MPLISGSGGVSAAAIEATFTAAGQVYQGTGAGTGALRSPPGFEIGYTQITARANVTDTLESTATALISPGALTFDGGPVMCIFDAEYLVTPATLAGFVCVTLFEGATQITRLALATNEVAGQNLQFPCHNEFRFTPTVGAHTYKVCGFVSSITGTPAIQAGLGGTGADKPAFVRFVKV